MATAPARKQAPRSKSRLKLFIKAAALVLLAFWLTTSFWLFLLRWVDPPTTAVQSERRMQSWFQKGTYHKHYQFVPLSQISPDLQHAVVAAEDARFFQHHGFDWHAIQLAAEEDMEGGRIRGGSTITQQLVKNLFFGTSRSFLRKGAEFTLVPVAELFLSKRRILELYLNVVEWGPGVYGADAACRYHYRTGPRNISRQEAAQLAAVLPAPLKRRPEHMGRYSARIMDRMRQMGW